MANTREYDDQRRRYDEKKSGKKKLFGFLVAFIVVFCVGLWIGDRYMANIRKWAGMTARKTLEAPGKVLKGATSLASKEELTGAVESCDDLDANEKERLVGKISEAYKTKSSYEGPYRAGVEQLWDDAGRLYDEAREDGEITGSELRGVVGKLTEATKAMQ